MTCFHQSRGGHRDLSVRDVAMCGVERKSFFLPQSMQAHDTDSGISQLEYGSQVSFANIAESKGSFSTGVDISVV
ncbi:unnamed protein product [Sphagnum tenellum]